MGEEEKDLAEIPEKPQTLEAFIAKSDNVHFKNMKLGDLTDGDRAIFEQFIAGDLTEQKVSAYGHLVDEEEDVKMKQAGIVISRERAAAVLENSRMNFIAGIKSEIIKQHH